MLLPNIIASAPSRIVNVSSLGHKFASKGIPFDKINSEETYSPMTAYAQSKLANILFTRYLAKELEGKQVYVNVL